MPAYRFLVLTFPFLLNINIGNFSRERNFVNSADMANLFYIKAVLVPFCEFLFYFLESLSLASWITLAAASFPPKPKANPKAKVRVATNPVNKVLIKASAIPSWIKIAMPEKI